MRLTAVFFTLGIFILVLSGTMMVPAVVAAVMQERVIAAAFIGLFGEDLGYHAMRSVLRGMAGFLSAVVIGVLAGILMAWYRPVRILVNPILRCFYPMPKSALIPLTTASACWASAPATPPRRR